MLKEKVQRLSRNIHKLDCRKSHEMQDEWGVKKRKKYHWINLDLQKIPRVSWLVQSSPNKYTGPHQASNETR